MNTPTSGAGDRHCVVIVANPYSGIRPNRRIVEDLVASLARCKLAARVLWDPSERREVLADPDLERSARCVVVVGGDGTVADVINEKPRGLSLAVLPAGNENLFARAIGFRTECESLVAAIVAGRTQWIDLGRAGSRFFSLMVGVGFDADVVQRAARRRRRQRSRRSVHLERPDVSHGRARHIRIVGTPPAPVQLDGDPAGLTPIEIDVLPEALAILVP